MPSVYLVDDDPAVLRALSRVLKQEGFGVETFASAEGFLASPARSASGCLVLDVSMPGIDGLDLQKHLAEAGGTMPIVFVTGHGDIPMSVQAMKAGAADFLTKPVSSDALIGAVRKALRDHEAVRAAREEVAELVQRFASLTEREKEVVSGLVRGKLNKQIAGDLGVVEQTVKFHRARVMERMRARTLAELMHMVARLASGAPGTLPAHGDGAPPAPREMR